jgi:hypothetical protein
MPCGKNQHFPAKMGLNPALKEKAAAEEDDKRKSSPGYPWLNPGLSLLPMLQRGAVSKSQSLRVSHLQTNPSSGSITSPIRLKPHLVRTRVEALASGRVWARTTRTSPLSNANLTKAAAASVA